MMGRQSADQASLFYEFRLEDRIPKNHLLRRINGFVAAVLADVHEQLQPYYSEIGRPSVDPELMIRMLIVGYCYGLRSERRLTQEVELHLAYRWFCRLDLDDKVPHHSTFSENRLHRFRESDVFRHIFERIVAACMAAGLVKGDGFAVDASVMEANASRYHGKTPDEIAWAEPERQTRAVKEYLAGLDADAEPNPDRKPPKVISPSDPCSAWTAKANKRVQFGYGLNYLIDIENAVIVDVEPTPARTYDEVECTKTMLDRTERRLQPEAQAACRRHRLWNWSLPRLVGRSRDRASYPSSRCQRARRRHVLSPRLSLGPAARRLRLPKQQGAAHYRYRPRRHHASLSRLQVRLRCLCTQDAVLSQHACTTSPPRCSRGCPRCGAPTDADKGLSQVAR